MLLKQKPRAPLYSTLSNVFLILDATGLRNNTDNSYGIVNAQGVVTTWRGVAPGSHTGDFVSSGLGPGNTGSAFKWIDGFLNYSGGASLTQSATPLGTFDFLSHPSTTKWTAYFLCKIGNESNPETIYGLLGNNQTSQGSRGASVVYDDRSTVSNTDNISSTITKGTAGFIVEARPDNIVLPNIAVIIRVETDLTLAAADRQKFFINGVQFPFTTLSPSTATVTGPAFPLQIGAAGNNLFPLHGWYSHVILQTGIETSGVATAFEDSLRPFTRGKSNQFYNVDESRTYSQNTFLSESIYYLNVSVIRNPITGAVMAVFGNWTSAGHTYHEDNYVAFRKSTDNGKTFAAKATAFNPGDDMGITDCGAFYDDSGVIHGFANTWDGAGSTPTVGTSELWYFTSSNDGDNWSNQQITVPSDGLTSTHAYGNGYQSDGYNFFSIYRQNNDASSSAVYVLRWPVGGDISTDLEWKLVLSGATHINEGSIARTGANSHVIVLRNESTLEWTQARTSDNWDTPTVDGDLTFGETNTVAGPVRILPIDVIVDGIKTRILKCYYPLRGTAILKAVYALPANIIANGLTGWDLDTKETIVDDTEIIHYGGAYHIDYGDGPSFNFLAIYTREVVASATSTLIYFNGPTNGYANVLTQLGL